MENLVARGHWSHKLDVLLSYIGYCVGLGNIYRFPYLCYRNGGGAFLIPYVLVLVLTGLPVYYMEIMLGQYSARSATILWKISPLFKGLGYTMVISCAIFCLYYNQLLAYVLHYLFSSFTSKLPWSTCDNPWNTPLCKSDSDNTTLYISLNGTENIVYSTTLNGTYNFTKQNLPAKEYWDRYVLNITESIDDMGSLEWRLALLLLLAWILTFLCLIKGIKSTGKVVYFTATFPYIVLTILLIRGVTLPGSLEGLKFYLIPDFKKLAIPKVWGDAASQIFFSLGHAWGILITFGSYNKFHHKSEKDAVIATAMCAGTSIFAGFAIFSIIGFLAHMMGEPIANVMDSGPGLAFIAYPEAIKRMPVAPLWSVLFFFMMVTVGLDSQFTCMECIITGVIDEFPHALRKHKTWVSLGFCCSMFLLALPMSMQGGMYLLCVFDWYATTFPPLVVCILEVLVVSYIYGFKRFEKDIRLMVGKSPNIYWRISWLVTTPLISVAILMFQIAYFTPVTYNGKRFPWWAEALGWVSCALCILAIPVWMVIRIAQRRPKCQVRELLRTVKELTRPEPDWGPQEKPTIDAEEMKQLNTE